jgi:DNA-binding GntR family transcriptional regulator
LDEYGDSLPRVKRETLGEQVAQTLRNLISLDRLKPGDRIVEADWATKLDVSRGPVRDAIRQLAAEGLVTCPPKGSAYVSEPSMEELRALVGLRNRMEEFAIELAIQRITAEGIAELRGILDEMRVAASEVDENLLRDLDVRYHRTLWSWAGSARLTELLSLAISPLLLSRLWLAYPGDVLASHVAGLDAIAAGDMDAVRSRLCLATQLELDVLNRDRS